MPPLPEAVHPYRLSIRGEQIFDEVGNAIRLRGVNLEGALEGDAEDIAKSLHMNFVRLRVSFIPENRADTDSGFTDEYRAKIDQWVNYFKAQKIWILIEMRANDNVSNDPAFFDVSDESTCTKPTTCPNVIYYARAWRYLANTYKDTDYIAGYGILAEPSANQIKDAVETYKLVIGLQKYLMKQIAAIDSRTPFFIGTDYNYDTMEYRIPDYFTAFSEYPNRLVYEVNFLTPKEWIKDGSWTVPAPNPTYPLADPLDGYGSLLDATGESPDTDLEIIFNHRRIEPGNYPKTLSKGYISWYLQWPLDFQSKYHVPLYCDQFGASSNALGHLDYERDLIRFFEGKDIHWTRWSYNAGNDPSRFIQGNGAVYSFYSQQPWK